jgi:hypothetical protein
MAYLGKEIFPIQLFYPLEHTLLMTVVNTSFGDGFETRVTKNLLWSTYDVTTNPGRPDGLGNVGQAYRGVNQFGINVRNMQHVNDVRGSGSLKNADKFWLFYQSRNGSEESFWFYNPAELTTIDTSGATNTGRYLVRFSENLSRQLFMRMLYNSSITLIEVRS